MNIKDDIILDTFYAYIHFQKSLHPELIIVRWIFRLSGWKDLVSEAMELSKKLSICYFFPSVPLNLYNRQNKLKMKSTYENQSIKFNKG